MGQNSVYAAGMKAIRRRGFDAPGGPTFRNDNSSVMPAAALICRTVASIAKPVGACAGFARPRRIAVREWIPACAGMTGRGARWMRSTRYRYEQATGKAQTVGACRCCCYDIDLATQRLEVSAFHLAQLNIAQMKYAIDDPAMAEFVERLGDINALADQAPGFVWRLQTDAGDATAIDYFGADKLVNMSVWQDLESLHQYVFRSAHNEVMARRKQWFDRPGDAYAVLWWVSAGQIPALYEAGQRLRHLRQHGSSAFAFTFKQPFPAE
jgi:heme-degrading monooxygenase HmoA